MKHRRNTKKIRLAGLLVGMLGSAAMVLPITGFANPASGNFPATQAAQGYYPQKARPAQVARAPSYPQYQSYSPYQMPFGYGRSMPWMQQPAYGYNPYQQNQPRQMNYSSPNYQFSNMTPFGNSFSPTSMFNNNNYPTPWSNSNNWNPWSNGNNSQMPFFSQNNTNKKKAWGDTRHIWPDFYTGFTEEFWDKSTNAPHDMGRMPGGWKAPSLSSPDPVTVGDAVLNQFPPIMEEMGNMMDFSN
ncbi:MAG: hypothetical protein V3U84_01110 [Thiotrichaceae bacterium]